MRSMAPPRLQVFADIPLRPTVTGLFWLAAVLGLLATAINYGNNLVFAMSFLLLAVWLQAGWRCHRHLARLNWLAHAPAPVFAGDSLRLEGRIARALPTAGVFLANGGERGRPATADPAGEALCELDVPVVTRGEYRFDQLRLRSCWPLGLWQAQRPLPSITTLVYPRPAGDRPMPANAPTQAHRQAATDDFQDLRRYMPGDTPRRINWRILARRDELLVNRFDGDKGGHATWFDFADCSGDAERGVSLRGGWILAAEQAGREYGIRLPGTRLSPAHGRRHRGNCLRHLALFRQADASA